MTVASIEQNLRQLNLPTFIKRFSEVAIEAEKENHSHVDYLARLAEEEVEHRRCQRIKALLKEAKLPRNKLLSDFDVKRIPGLSPTLLQTLAKGDFMDKFENVLIFGNPGTGKTHLSIALANEWCLQGRRVYYTNAANLVQQLLQAKQDLKLKQMIQKLDRYEVLLIDDISYIPFERTETDVLFQLLSERYEMRSTLISSNLPFGQWSTLFKDEMTTAAVIDRLVHHAVILELNGESYRIGKAKLKKQQKVGDENG